MTQDKVATIGMLVGCMAALLIIVGDAMYYAEQKSGFDVHILSIDAEMESVPSAQTSHEIAEVVEETQQLRTSIDVSSTRVVPTPPPVVVAPSESITSGFVLIDSTERHTFGEDYDDIPGFELLATYPVSGSVLGPRQDVPQSATYRRYQDNTLEHQFMWAYARLVLPDAYIQQLSSFSIFTDGFDETVALVEVDDNSPTHWALLVDAVDVFDGAGQQRDLDDFTATLVHELGHILTLGVGQIAIDTELLSASEEVYGVLFAEKEAQCDTFFTDEGCSYGGSYINAFYEAFWKDIYDDFLDTVVYSDDPYAVDDFYQEYEDWFVTDYAATNVAEDIAESWTAFVFGVNPWEGTIAAEKVDFFYQYPELVTLKNTILSRIGL